MSESEIVPSPPTEPPVPIEPPAPVGPARPPVAPAPPPVSPAVGQLKGFADVPLHLAIEIGRLQVSVGELMSMKDGSIFKIPKAAGEPFDICANGQAVACGEVIVVENSSGVRLTEVLKL